MKAQLKDKKREKEFDEDKNELSREIKELQKSVWMNRSRSRGFSRENKSIVCYS